MEVKTIKGIDDKTWIEFKALAAKKRLTMGKLLMSMVKSYSADSSYIWNEILYGKRNVSDEDAKETRRITKKLRKERGFRNVSDF